MLGAELGRFSNVWMVTTRYPSNSAGAAICACVDGHRVFLKVLNVSDPVSADMYLMLSLVLYALVFNCSILFVFYACISSRYTSSYLGYIRELLASVRQSSCLCVLV